LIAGGRSNLTFRLDDGASRWVLRMPPRAKRTPSAHDVAREFKITQALGAVGVPVPPAVVLCGDETVLGAPFAVAEFVHGRTVQSRADLDTLDDAILAGVCAELVKVLAALHRVDHVAAGLKRFGRPDGYAGRQLKRWSGQWELLLGDYALASRHSATELAGRLSAAIPEQSATGVVHGDFRIDNTLLLLGGAGCRGGRLGAVHDR
jgi:aminoglycoside phosphotransferase (APT) family kinase protein